MLCCKWKWRKNFLTLEFSDPAQWSRPVIPWLFPSSKLPAISDPAQWSRGFPTLSYQWSRPVMQDRWPKDNWPRTGDPGKVTQDRRQSMQRINVWGRLRYNWMAIRVLIVFLRWMTALIQHLSIWNFNKVQVAFIRYDVMCKWRNLSGSNKTCQASVNIIMSYAHLEA